MQNKPKYEVWSEVLTILLFFAVHNVMLEWPPVRKPDGYPKKILHLRTLIKFIKL